MSISPMDLATYYGVDDIPAALSIGDNLHSLLVAIFSYDLSEVVTPCGKAGRNTVLQA